MHAATPAHQTSKPARSKMVVTVHVRDVSETQVITILCSNIVRALHCAGSHQNSHDEFVRSNKASGTDRSTMGMELRLLDHPHRGNRLERSCARRMYHNYSRETRACCIAVGLLCAVCRRNKHRNYCMKFVFVEALRNIL